METFWLTTLCGPEAKFFFFEDNPLLRLLHRNRRSFFMARAARQTSFARRLPRAGAVRARCGRGAE